MHWLLMALLMCADAAIAAIPGGKLVIVGSDTLAELMTAWSAGFTRENPQVSVELQAGGSAAAPTALLRGTANVGSMSRRMTRDEKQQFVIANGAEPLEIALATDTIVLIVNPDNPITTLSVNAVAKIFGTGSCGFAERFKTWGDVGLTGEWSDRRIEAFGRTAASGTYDFFRDSVLCGGDPGMQVGELPGAASVVDTVAAIPGAVGYTGIGFVDERVRLPDIDLGGDGLVTTAQFSSSQIYPLNRQLYLYLPLTDNQTLPAMECEFLRYIHSPNGLVLLERAGFKPANARVLQQLPGCAR